MERIVGGIRFGSKSALRDFVRRIVNAGGVGRVLNDEERAFILALLQNHPNRAMKIGAGVAEFRTFRDDYGNRALLLRRVDGSETDFSWTICVDAPSPTRDAIHAFRLEIKDQCDRFKNAAFVDVDAIVCPILGVYVRWESAHVDHAAPKTFKALVDAFCAEKRIALADVETTGHGDGEQKHEIADRALAASWRAFHAERAVLRVVSAAANVGALRLKGRAP